MQKAIVQKTNDSLILEKKYIKQVFKGDQNQFVKLFQKNT